MKTILIYLPVAAILLFSFMPAQTYTADNSRSLMNKEYDSAIAGLKPLSVVSPRDSVTHTVAGQTMAQKRAYERQVKAFKVYPNPANNVVYMHIWGKQFITLHNAKDSLIFRASIREKATVNVKKLPEGHYYFTDEKTGIRHEMTIVH